MKCECLFTAHINTKTVYLKHMRWFMRQLNKDIQWWTSSPSLFPWPFRCWITRSGGNIYIYFYNLVSFVFENIIFLNFHNKTKRVTAYKVTIFWGSLSKASEFSTKFCLSSFCSLSSINLVLDASLPPAKMILITLPR